MSNEKTETVAEQWFVGGNSSPLGDTGDYLTETFITNKEIQLFCADENITDEELQEVCDKLNLPISAIVEFAVKYVAENAGLQVIEHYGEYPMRKEYDVDREQSILSLIPEITTKYNEQRG